MHELDYIIDYCYGVNQLFLNDEEISIDNITSKLGLSVRSLNRKTVETTSLSPVNFMNLLRFYSAFERIQKGEKIKNVMFLIKVDSLSYFYQKFKYYFKLKPSEVKPITKCLIPIQNISSNPKSCNIARYHFFRNHLDKEIAHILSHYDFNDITSHPINRRHMKNLLQDYLMIRIRNSQTIKNLAIA